MVKRKIRKRKIGKKPAKLCGWLYRARDRDRWAVEIKPARDAAISRQGDGMKFVGRIDLAREVEQACRSARLCERIELDMTDAIHLAMKYDQIEYRGAKLRRQWFARIA